MVIPVNAAVRTVLDSSSQRKLGSIGPMAAVEELDPSLRWDDDLLLFWVTRRDFPDRDESALRRRIRLVFWAGSVKFRYRQASGIDAADRRIGREVHTEAIGHVNLGH